MIGVDRPCWWETTVFDVWFQSQDSSSVVRRLTVPPQLRSRSNSILIGIAVVVAAVSSPLADPPGSLLAATAVATTVEPASPIETDLICRVADGGGR